MDEYKEQLEPIVSNTKRMMNIINHLRSFSRQSQVEVSPVDVNKVINDSTLLISEQLRLNNIELRKDLCNDFSIIQGHANQLKQVFLNLISNAKDACKSRMQDEITKPKEDSPKTGVIEIITEKAGNSKDAVDILVKDNGGGIPVDKVDKIFDPFFTTKEVGKGTGLGLSISYGIIQDHQGEIEVAETGPEGTTFKIKLPSIEKPKG